MYVCMYVCIREIEGGWVASPNQQCHFTHKHTHTHIQAQAQTQTQMHTTPQTHHTHTPHTTQRHRHAQAQTQTHTCTTHTLLISSFVLPNQRPRITSLNLSSCTTVSPCFSGTHKRRVRYTGRQAARLRDNFIKRSANASSCTRSRAAMHGCGVQREEALRTEPLSASSPLPCALSSQRTEHLQRARLRT